jgi:SdrD B-like domain
LLGYANSTASNPIPGTGAIGSADGTDKGINNATPATAGISSPPVTVGPGPSPTPQLPTGESGAGDNDAAVTTAAGDANDNMAVDLGFYRLTAGNQIWLETNGNSTYTSGTDATPPSVQGITVELRDASTNAVIATTTTDPSGNYQFVSLSDGNPIPAGAYYVSLPTLPAGTQPIPVGGALTDNNNQGAIPVAPIAGVAVRTGTFNLAPGVTTENQTVTNATGTTAQPTLDIGFQAVYSLGNRVWVDANNNGAVDLSESGLDGVTVNLRDGSGAQLYRTPTGAITTVAAGNTAITTTTSNGGHYLFTSLPPGSYTVEIVTPTVGANSYVSSTGVNGGVTGPFEPAGAAAFGNTATNFDHGIQFAPNTIRSRPITLGPGQPTTEDGNTTPGQTDTTPDNQSNLTVDFGVFIPAELGNFVWQDIDRDGMADAGEPGINGVTVTLRDPLTDAVIAPVTTIDRPAGETSGQPGPGWYQFTNLIPGNYVIEFSAPGYSSTASGTPAGTSGTQPETNNNQLPPGVSTGRTATVSVSAGDNNPQLDAGFMPDPIAVPTLSQWLQVMLALVMFGAVAHTFRRRARAAARRA